MGQIGNLILVTKDLNQKLENKNFKEKKQLLLKHNYKEMLPDNFWAVDQLSMDLITQRTADLATLSYDKIWKI